MTVLVPSCQSLAYSGIGLAPKSLANHEVRLLLPLTSIVGLPQGLSCGVLFPIESKHNRAYPIVLVVVQELRVL